MNGKVLSCLMLSAILMVANAFATLPRTVDPGIIENPIALPIDKSQPFLIPTPPRIHANGYLLADFNTGKLLVKQNIDKRMPPASLTKLMTLYIISEALNSDRIHLTDKVLISKKAWQTGGSKMFIKVGDRVSVSDLIQGIVVTSGNDACVAMAEYIGGSEDAFVSLMNQEAQSLGMKSTHYMDCNGLPHQNHYTTARDLFILTRALIKRFPQYYHWYKQKWFTYNGIKQPNRNRLLWRDRTVDGVKTGHTSTAGYCLVASGKRDNMRLISVVLGTKTDQARIVESEKLLTFGFRFYDSPKMYSAHQELIQHRAWMGTQPTIAIGPEQDVYLSIPRGQYKHIKAQMKIDKIIEAPINQGQPLGTLDITLHGQPMAIVPLVALNNNPKGGRWVRFKDYLQISFRKFFHS